MARSIWTGSLSFGLVNIPVSVFPATRDKSIRFNQFEAGSSDRIRYRKVNERTGEEVDSAEIVKGYDLGGGEFVILTDEELASVAPEKSRTIEIADFVDLGDIDPVYYRTTYYLAPQGENATKAYALLRKAMAEANRVGIATWVNRNKEYLVAVRPDDGVVALETMFFADEVRPATEDLPDLPSDKLLTRRELDMATMLIDSMGAAWRPDQYHDTYRSQVEAIIDRKRQGEEIVTEIQVEPTTKVIDLMEALQASVRARGASAAGSPRAASARKTPTKAAPRAKKASAKKAPAKKAPAKRAPAAKKVLATSRQRKAS